MNGPVLPSPTGATSELDKLRRRVEALSRKRDEADERLTSLLRALLPLDDLLADTRRRAGALHEARSAREAVSAAVAVREQIDAAHHMLRSEFARHDVRPMHAMGRPVDPAEMHIIGTEADPASPEGTVLREQRTGFRQGAITLRAAQVVIAAPAPPPTPALAPTAAPAPAEPDTAARANRNQPRRTTRAQRRTARKPTAQRERRRS